VKPDKISPVWTETFTPFRLLLLIGLLLFALYPEVVLGTHSFFYRDFGFFTYPVVRHAAESLRQGEIPLWNPFNNCGVPFLAQWNTSVGYPLLWVCALVPLPWSLNFFCLGHLLLAGAGMYGLARRWTQNRFAASVAGLVFALNGLTLSCLMWTSNLAALCWMPAVVLAAEQGWRLGGKRIVVAALAGAMQLLAGAPEIVLMTWLVIGMLWLGQIWQRNIPTGNLQWRLLWMVLLVAALSAFQLLPFFELMRFVQRDSPGNAAWSLPVWGWANFFVPLFRCSPSMLGVYFQSQQQWASSYYVGIGTLMFVLLALGTVRQFRTWWLAALALGGIALALGENGFLHPWLRGLIPVKFVVLPVFALPLLAALAVDRVTQVSPSDAGDARRVLFWAGLLILMVVVGIVAFAPSHVDAGVSWEMTLWNGVTRAAFLIIELGLLFVLVKVTNPRGQAVLGLGILFLFGLDVLLHAPSQNPTLPNRIYAPAQFKLSPLPRLGESRAMISPRMQALLGNLATPDRLEYYLGMRRSLYDNCNLLDDLPKVNGFFSLYLRAETEVRALLYNPTNFPAGLVDFLGVSQISDPEVMFKWNARTTFLPLATAGQKPVFADAAGTLNALAAPEFDPRRVVYLPVTASELITATNAAHVEIRSSKISAHRVELMVEARAPALVVLAQSYYPAWRAEVDAKPAHLWRANHAYQALEVPAGFHAVRVFYDDRPFRLGGKISLGALLVCLLIALLRGNPTASPPVS
jgi:hypothetical protein